MRGVTFAAWRADDEFIPLVELLLAVGPWTLRGVSWSVGDSEFGTGRRGSAELARLARTGARVSTLALVDLVSDGVQLVDGKICGWRDPAGDPFVVRASVRGDSWDVQSIEDEVLIAVRRCFDGGLDLSVD